MQGTNSSDLDESIKNAVQQWVAQVDQDVDVGSVDGRVHVSPRHAESLQLRNPPN